MRGHVKPITRERLEYIWGIARQGPTELGYAYFRARRRKKNLPDKDLWLPEWDRIPLEEPERFAISDAQVAANARVLEDYDRASEVEISSVQWFVPWVPTVFLGGLYTILRFAAHFRREHGVESRFCIYDVDESKARRMTSDLRRAFPELAEAEVTVRQPPGGGVPYSHLKDCDAAIATFWPSAYPVLRFNRAKTKFFFVQDFEPYFYPASSAFALAEESYRFGFPGIVNTPGLAAAYRAYGNPAVSFVPAVDRDRYRPPAEARSEPPVRVFFYGRPSNARNAFGLGLAGLADLKKRYGDRVEVISAGESWNPGQFGYADTISNVGRLRNLEEVSDLYRSCHVGLVLMLTKHPSYQPFEFMASGVACVSNANPDTVWFLKDGRNCLLTRPVPDAIGERLGTLVEDRDLRERIAATALEEVRALRWDDQIERVWRTMTKQGEGFERDPQPPATSAANDKNRQRRNDSISVSTANDIVARKAWRRVEAPPEVRAVPTMLSAQEQALLYTLARDYATGEGAIIDAGCFLGGSSAALLAGVRDRPEPWTGPPVASYDRFLVEEYTMEQFFPDRQLAVGDSFRSRYDRYVAEFGVPHDVRHGDIVRIGWSGEPIEVLFLDVMKTWEINDAVLRDFFPHVIPGRTIVVHQDYGWGLLPWLHITVELMRDSLRWLDAMPFGSHVFLVDRPISEPLLNTSIQREVPDGDKLALLDRAIASNQGVWAEMVRLSKAAMLSELGLNDEAHQLVDAVDLSTDDASVKLCIKMTRAELPRRNG